MIVHKGTAPKKLLPKLELRRASESIKIKSRNIFPRSRQAFTSWILGLPSSGVNEVDDKIARNLPLRRRTTTTTRSTGLGRQG
jgi:hypothetical protein